MNWQKHPNGPGVFFFVRDLRNWACPTVAQVTRLTSLTGGTVRYTANLWRAGADDDVDVATLRGYWFGPLDDPDVLDPYN